jgi:hypothetical protein
MPGRRTPAVEPCDASDGPEPVRNGAKMLSRASCCSEDRSDEGGRSVVTTSVFETVQVVGVA